MARAFADVAAVAAGAAGAENVVVGHLRQTPKDGLVQGSYDPLGGMAHNWGSTLWGSRESRATDLGAEYPLTCP